jgi:D-glycero-alpha-D-manno-heptose-7-phosphate kinase
MLCFTGLSRYTSDIAKSKLDNMGHRERELHRMKEMVDEGIAILQAKGRPVDEFGKLLHEAWKYKRSL